MIPNLEGTLVTGIVMGIKGSSTECSVFAGKLVMDRHAVANLLKTKFKMYAFDHLQNIIMKKKIRGES